MVDLINPFIFTSTYSNTYIIQSMINIIYYQDIKLNQNDLYNDSCTIGFYFV